MLIFEYLGCQALHTAYPPTIESQFDGPHVGFTLSGDIEVPYLSQSPRLLHIYDILAVNSFFRRFESLEAALSWAAAFPGEVAS